MPSVTVRRDGACVVVIFQGKLAAQMPYEAALELSRELLRQGKLAEEYAMHDQVILDGAILLRAGVPVGLTDDPKLLAEIGKEAAWNTRLRKCMAGGIKSQALVGRPTVTNGALAVVELPEGVRREIQKILRENRNGKP